MAERPYTIKMIHPEGTIFVVSTMARSGVCIGNIRTFAIEDDAWKYFKSKIYQARCWATYSNRQPVLLSTKVYMRTKGLLE